jgi:Xaa-Pro dipeptidase
MGGVHPGSARLANLFANHLERVCEAATEALRLSADAGEVFDGLIVHSGSTHFYHAQDREVEFQPLPHFMRFAPVPAADQFVVYRPGSRPTLIRVVRRDFWYAPAADGNGFWNAALQASVIDSLENLRPALGNVRRHAYLGDHPALAESLGLERSAIEPPALMSALDWFRAEKTPYEVESIRAAARMAAGGHAASRRLAEGGASEREIHAAYLEHSGLLEHETPYTNIVAWDDHAGILHYQGKRRDRPRPGRVFLLDAGASVRGYASDITRTYALPGAHPVFAQLLQHMHALQRQLVAGVGPGVDFVALHEAAVRGVCGILREAGILRVEPAAAIERGVFHAFFPHGLGHHLGLQVHDVGGHLQSPRGERRAPPPHHPWLRTTRVLAPGHVVTIEPGLYFIPMLLRDLRASAHAECVSWALVDQLVSCGGIRIEDDILVTPTGREDLSRPFVPA